MDVREDKTEVSWNITQRVESKRKDGGRQTKIILGDT